MGKKSSNSGSSWLTMVKRAFRSPTKDQKEKKSCRRREEHDPEEEEKKREKRRWIFRKMNSNNNNHVQVEQCETKTTSLNPISDANQRHANAVATATAAAAQAAAATAQAAVDIVRLTRRPSSFVQEQWAAIVIQTAFRGYLAKRALRALKGLVKLQALVRAYNVRKQVKLKLKCMQALVRVQDRVRDQRARLSHEGSRKSMFDETNNCNCLSWESKYFQEIRERRSISRDISSILDDCDERPCTKEEIDVMLQSKKEAALKREKPLAYAFSSQIWRSRRSPSAGDEMELDEERTRWLDRWMATKQLETSSSRASTDHRRETIKTVEIDTPRPRSYSTPNIVVARKSQSQNHPQQRQPYVASPHPLRPHPNFYLHQQTPITLSPCKNKPLQVRSASPRCPKDEKCYSASHTPSLGSRYRYAMGAYGSNSATCAMPNYMAATESAKARVRSQSAPRQRPSTPERERGGSVKKRLSYPDPDPPHCSIEIGCSSYSQNLRSPSFKSVQAGHFAMEHRSNYSSCYTESIGGEISPCSTTDLRWLK